MSATVATTNTTTPLSKNKHLLRWVEKMAELTQPDHIHWVDGSEEENEALCQELVNKGTFIRSEREAVAELLLRALGCERCCRVEDRTFICSLSKDNAGPTNNWEDPYVMRRTVEGPFQWLHARPHDVCAALQHGSDRFADVADRRASSPTPPYVVVNMRIMARIGMDVFKIDRSGHQARRAVHALAWARRSRPGRTTCRGRAIKRSTSSISRRRARSGRYGSGYGGNALLGKKCFALRIASSIARDEGWMAEHMLILGVENPQGREDLRGGGVSERVRQNEFRDADSAQGFRRAGRCWTVGDDIAWIKPDANGRLARDQSGSRILRRRARHVGEDESERDGDAGEAIRSSRTSR